MANSQPLDDPTFDTLQGQQVIRRFTFELEGSNELERSTKAARVQIDEEEENEERLRLKSLYESSGNGDYV